MNRSARVFHFFAMTLMALNAVRAVAGANSSGGGTSIRMSPNSRPVLLDLFLHNADFSESQAGRPVVQNCGNTNKQETWESMYGFAPFYAPEYSYGAETEVVLSRLKLWEKSSPVLVGQIEEALYSGWLNISFGEVPQVDSYWLPEGFLKTRPNATLETVAYYHPLLGPTVSAKIWNEFGNVSRAALMIHEALREIQIFYGDKTSEQILQHVTARIVLDSPKAGETLDDPALYGPYLAKAMRNGSSYDFSTALGFFMKRNEKDIKSILQNPSALQAVRFFRTKNPCVSADF